MIESFRECHPRRDRLKFVRHSSVEGIQITTLSFKPPMSSSQFLIGSPLLLELLFGVVLSLLSVIETSYTETCSLSSMLHPPLYLCTVNQCASDGRNLIMFPCDSYLQCTRFSSFPLVQTDWAIFFCFFFFYEMSSLKNYNVLFAKLKNCR